MLPSAMGILLSAATGLGSGGVARAGCGGFGRRIGRAGWGFSRGMTAIWRCRDAQYRALDVHRGGRSRAGGPGGRPCRDGSAGSSSWAIDPAAVDWRRPWLVAALEGLDDDHGAAAAGTRIGAGRRFFGIDGLAVAGRAVEGRHGEEVARPCQVLGAPAVGEQAVVANAVEA